MLPSRTSPGVSVALTLITLLFTFLLLFLLTFLAPSSRGELTR